MDIRKKILMVNGKKRAGKDYISDIVCNNYSFTKVALARKLKDAACSIAGITFDEMENLKNNELTFKITKQQYLTGCRAELLQSFEDLGYPGQHMEFFEDAINAFDFNSLQFTQFGNDFVFDARVFLQEMGGIWKVVFEDNQIWAKLSIAAIDAVDGDVIISDFRYPYEETLIAEHYKNVTTIKVLGKNLYETDGYDQHSSETALNDYHFDYHINNTIWDENSLIYQVDGLMKELRDA